MAGYAPGYQTIGDMFADPLDFTMGDASFHSIPTAQGQVQRGSVPRYFTQPPTGLGALSPLAQAYLARMFPQRLWGEEVSPYTITPYAAAQPGKSQVPYTDPTTGEYFPKGREVRAPVAEVPEVMGETEKVTPRVPSAQLYKQLESQGAVPN
ncbi:MAG: hypothetical protein KKB31_07850, partial [Nanoarchaeota archaeon]|nr:hypothetical protein [Nanoarchaeota archaeon]